MIKNKPINNSSELVGKIVKLEIDGQDSLDCVIDVMEEDGILVHYYTEEEDITSICEEDDDGAELTIAYYPWTAIQQIQYRECDN